MSGMKASLVGETRYAFVVQSPKHGSGLVITDGKGVIVSSDSQYGLYVGWGFRQFLAGLKKDDPATTYQQVLGEWETVEQENKGTKRR